MHKKLDCSHRAGRGTDGHWPRRSFGLAEEAAEDLVGQEPAPGAEAQTAVPLLQEAQAHQLIVWSPNHLRSCYSPCSVYSSPVVSDLAFLRLR